LAHPLDPSDRSRRGRAFRRGGLAELRGRLRPDADGVVLELHRALERDRAAVRGTLPAPLDVLPAHVRGRLPRALQPALAGGAVAARTPWRMGTVDEAVNLRSACLASAGT